MFDAQHFKIVVLSLSKLVNVELNYSLLPHQLLEVLVDLGNYVVTIALQSLYHTSLVLATFMRSFT